jgi:hypothetical protein
VRIQVIEGQSVIAVERQLNLVAFKDRNGLVKSKLLGEHQSNLRQLDAERLPVDPVELLRADERDGFRLCLKVCFADGCLELGHQCDFDANQLPVRHIEKIAASTGGIEYLEAHQFAAERKQLLHGGCLGDSLVPRS